MLQQLQQVPWWMAALATLGAIALVSAVLTLFAALGARPGRYSLTETPPIGSEPFLMGVSGIVNAPLMRGGTARLLNNGVEIFPAILKAIGEAERTINFMVYIWEKGKASERMTEALLERQRAGVEVRLMLDAVGSLFAPRSQLKRLREAGVRVHFFNPLRFGRITSFYKRNHRRAIVIDGRVAFTGGAAVGDQWLGDAEDAEHWRDMMVEVRGCLATNLQSSFAQLWANSGGEVLVGDAFFPTDHEEDLPGEELSRHVHLMSSPAQASHPLRSFFWTTFACAGEAIHLTSAYFAPDAETRRILCERARAGVDVRLLLPNHLTDAKVVRWAGHAYYAELLEAGVRIWEYQTTMIHSKTLVVDGVWSIVGSANMDIRSKELNQESVIGILDRGLGGELEETFARDLLESKEIRLEEWRRRGILARVLERGAGLFAEQY
ncbi:MAG TPA: phospholipase D-like domain-containing protein [Longimicrobium sp.]|nr:phospholipase D-like domain-containing protein [Longimicrobium sp.]